MNTYSTILLRDGVTTIDPNIFLPPGGNYLDECKDCHIVAIDPPNVKDPVYCVLKCLCPKKMEDGTIKYYDQQLRFKYKKQSIINAPGDGTLVIVDEK
jgi:hypothetical protein